MQGECEFVIYSTEKLIEPIPHPGSPSVLSPVEIVTQAIGTSLTSTLYSDPKLSIGVDLRYISKELQISMFFFVFV